MSPTLRLWGGLGHRGLSGSVRLPSGFGSEHTACEHFESHFFTFIYFAYFIQKWEMRPLRTSKSMSAANEFFAIPRGKFLPMWQVCSPGGSSCAAKGGG